MTGSNDKSAIGDAHGEDLNTASRQHLEQVGGIKGERSERLIQGRPYQSWDEVEKVPGFNQKMVEDLQRAGFTLGGKGGEHGSSSHGKSGSSSAKGRGDEDRDDHRSSSSHNGSDDHRSGSHDSDRGSSAKAADHGRDEHHSGSRASSDRDRDEDRRSGSKGSDDHRSSGGGNESEQESLKSREYTDAQGNVHHHTRTYEEQHGGKQDNKR